MKVQHPVTLVLIIIFSASTLISQQNQLDVDGHVKIRGNMNLAHMDDNFSLVIGKDAGINTDYSSIRANTFVGSLSGKNNTTGADNVFIGALNGRANTEGSSNSFVGFKAGLNNKTGGANAFFGFQAGGVNTTGASNAFFGFNAGLNSVGSKNTYLGSMTGQLNSSLNNAIAIGYNAKVDCSNCAVIGGLDVDAVNVGIGTANPNTTLDVKGTATVGVPGDLNVLLNLNSERNWVFEQRGTAATTSLELASIGGGGNKNFIINTLGDVGIGITNPTHPLHMASGAHVTSGGVWTNASSRALKENICALTVEEAISTMAELNPVKFNYKIQKDEEYIGFIAEDVPDLVATQDRKSLSPMDIAAVLSKVVQNQQLKLNEQDSEIKKITKEMKDLKLQLKALIVKVDLEN